MANIALTTANRVEVDESTKQLTLPAAEAITAGAPVRLDTSSGKFTNANASSAAEARVYGIATKTVAAGEAVTAIRRGTMDGFALAGLNYDAGVYLSDTDGRIADAVGTVNVTIGRVVPGTATTLGTAYDKLLDVDIEAAEDISLDSLTVAGATSLEGTVALGNSASADTVTITADTTVATGGLVTITDADALTEAGVIVPQYLDLAFSIDLHATKTLYNLFVAREAYQVVNIDYTPDIAQGGALTATVVKAVGTATPASATTPMHAEGAIDLNAAAHTVQPITLTATTADLQLAAGNRIGLVLSGAMTVGSGNVSIRMKRI